MYQLVCYACRLNRIDDARHWIERAIARDDSMMKLRPLDDPKLNAVWPALDLAWMNPPPDASIPNE